MRRGEVNEKGTGQCSVAVGVTMGSNGDEID